MLRKKSIKMLGLHSFVAIFLIMAMMFCIASVAAQETLVSVIDLVDGDDTIELPADTPVGYELTVNITIYDVENFAGWQINVTWDPRLLNITDSSDIWLPDDHAFSGYDPVSPPPVLNPQVGFVVVSCAIGPGAPEEEIDVVGERTLCQLNFTTVKDGTTEPASCEIVLDRESILYPTLLTDSWADELPFTEENLYYFIPEFPMVALLLTFLIITTVAVALTKKTGLMRARKTA